MKRYYSTSSLANTNKIVRHMCILASFLLAV